jgi:hypothetical protein
MVTANCDEDDLIVADQRTSIHVYSMKKVGGAITGEWLNTMWLPVRRDPEEELVQKYEDEIKRQYLRGREVFFVVSRGQNRSFTNLFSRFS